jgi:hypothetical protein
LKPDKGKQLNDDYDYHCPGKYENYISRGLSLKY